jgi:predicted tellurium resistance membrane protein TerC
MTAQILRGHILTLAACVLGVIGTGMVFGGAMHGDLHAISKGVPFLLVGLWWAGLELARSIDLHRLEK